MEKVTKSDISSVGDDVLDAQHAVILGYMARVHNHLLAGKGERELFELVDRLDTYCKLHFLDEEKLIGEMDFPEFATHKAQHALFVTHLENFAGRYEEQNSTKNIDDLMFLKNWFLEHIEEYDRKYAVYGTHSG
jgi:hemerythrin